MGAESVSLASVLSLGRNEEQQQKVWAPGAGDSKRRGWLASGEGGEERGSSQGKGESDSRNGEGREPLH